MRIHWEKYGRLHVHIYHNRIEFAMRDRSRWLLITYYLRSHSSDSKQSSKPIPAKTVKAIWKRALSLKRWKKDQPRWIPQEVLDCLKSEWGVEVKDA